MIDVTSRTWSTVAAWLEKEIADARARNDNPLLSDKETQALRGRIAALKDLQSLPDLIERVERAQHEASGREPEPQYMNPQDY